MSPDDLRALTVSVGALQAIAEADSACAAALDLGFELESVEITVDLQDPRMVQP